MRLHITLDDDLVAELDTIVGHRGRSGFINQAIKRAVEDARRWASLERAIGSIPDHGHEWDDDPAAWVREQRRADPRRVG